MKVEYTLTPEDVVAAMHERVKSSYGNPRWAQYRGLAAIFLVLLSQGVMLVAQGFPWPVVAGVLLLGVLFVLIPTLISKRQRAGIFRRLRLIPFKSMSLEVRPEGLALTKGTTAALTIWESIDRIAVSDAHAFFYPGISRSEESDDGGG